MTGPQRATLAAQSIQRSLHEPIDMTAIGAQLRVSRRQLERDFKRCFGVAPMQYARRQRFELAARALTGDASIVQVAVDHGYADQSHFTRVARQLTGYTPKALRAIGLGART